MFSQLNYDNYPPKIMMMTHGTFSKSEMNVEVMVKIKSPDWCTDPELATIHQILFICDFISFFHGFGGNTVPEFICANSDVAWQTRCVYYKKHKSAFLPTPMLIFNSRSSGHTPAPYCMVRWYGKEFGARSNMKSPSVQEVWKQGHRNGWIVSANDRVAGTVMTISLKSV